MKIKKICYTETIKHEYYTLKLNRQELEVLHRVLQSYAIKSYKTSDPLSTPSATLFNIVDNVFTSEMNNDDY